jgi:hypothetical protein
MKEAARKVSFHFNLSVKIARAQSGYRIVPDELQPANLRNFANSVYLFGGLSEWLLELLQYVDTERFRSPDLIWRDPGTGLAWDV